MYQVAVGNFQLLMYSYTSIHNFDIKASGIDFVNVKIITKLDTYRKRKLLTKINSWVVITSHRDIWFTSLCFSYLTEVDTILSIVNFVNNVSVIYFRSLINPTR